MESPIIYLIFAVIQITGQWTGVVWIGKHRYDGVWWVLASGTWLFTMGFTLYLISEYVKIGPVVSIDDAYWMSVGLPFITLGTIVFAFGFAAHGWKFAAVIARIEQLETLAAVQATELNRLRLPKTELLS